VQHDHLAIPPALDDAGAAHLRGARAVVAGADGAVDVVSDVVAFFRVCSLVSMLATLPSERETVETTSWQLAENLLRPR